MLDSSMSFHAQVIGFLLLHGDRSTAESILIHDVP
jgi:hypothetical protein